MAITSTPTRDLIGEAYQASCEHLREALDHLRELHAYAPGHGTAAYRAALEAEASTLVALERLERSADAFPPPSDDAAHPATDDPALQRLVSWRQERAEGRPAYLVCRNSVLVGALANPPGDLAELAEIPGVGPSFIARHGEAFLVALTQARALAH